MRIFDIFFDWLKGLWTAGGIFGRIVAIIGVLIGMIFLLVAIILNFGLKLFKIFSDETLFYSSKGYHFFKKILSTLNLTLSILIYYFLKLLYVLIPPKEANLTKPAFKITLIIFMIWDGLIAIFFYLISIIIFIVSIYWILSYIELFSQIGTWTLSYFNTTNTVLLVISKSFKIIEAFSNKLFSVNIFGIGPIWIVRIIGFCSIFFFRYFRLKETNPTMHLSVIIPYKSPFWDSQIKTQSKFRVIYSITFSIIIGLLIIIVMYVLDKRKLSLTADSLTKTNDYAAIHNENHSQLTDKNGTVKLLQKINENHKLNRNNFDVLEFNKLLSTAIVNIKAQEYDYAIKLLQKALDMNYTPTEFKKQIFAAKSFIKAREDADAIKILDVIIMGDK